MTMTTMDESRLSHIGKAALKELETKHKRYHKKLWALTSGKIIGDIQHGPRNRWEADQDPDEGHSDWLPDTMAGLLAKTQVWCDFMSLGVPDGVFMEKIKDALAIVAARSKERDTKIVVRFMFAHIITAPCDCTSVMEKFTDGLPSDSKLQIWVGAWRKGICWNHAKIVAVDGKHLYTGGHNLWDQTYLRQDPIHDTSIQLEGSVAMEGHSFANEQWKFIQKDQSTIKGWIVNHLPDSSLLPLKTRVTISEYPQGKASTFAPLFKEEMFAQQNAPKETQESAESVVPIISMGRYGKMVEKARSSDDAFIAMFDAAENVIRFLLQDVGPVNKTVAGRKIVYKGWPKAYMSAWGRAIWQRGVDIEIVLSNPDSCVEQDLYSNGWSCAEVAAEIIKTIQEQFPDAASDEDCRKKVADNLRVCYLKHHAGRSTWDISKNKVGLHSKFFIVDDVCTYVGSQNLYVFDLAEWGVLIDSKERTLEVMKTLWEPMWTWSYGDGSDCNVDEVMDALKIDHDPHGPSVPDSEIAELENNTDLANMKNSDLYLDGDAKAECCVIS